MVDNWRNRCRILYLDKANSRLNFRLFKLKLRLTFTVIEKFMRTIAKFLFKTGTIHFCPKDWSVAISKSGVFESIFCWPKSKLLIRILHKSRDRSCHMILKVSRFEAFFLHFCGFFEPSFLTANHICALNGPVFMANGSPHIIHLNLYSSRSNISSCFQTNMEIWRLTTSRE